jgi:hypothetical protein
MVLFGNGSIGCERDQLHSNFNSLVTVDTVAKFDKTAGV